MATKIPVPHYESTQEPLDDEERILMDPDTWDWENSYVIEPGPDPHYIFEVRLSDNELSRIEQAAAAKGMTVKEYVHRAALSWDGIERELSKPA